MIIDCHTHIDFAHTEPDIEGYLSASQMVDVCLILGCPQGDHIQTNQKISEFVRSHAQKVIGFGVIDPTQETISDKYVSELKEKLGLQGVVLYSAASGFHPTDSQAMRFYAMAQEMGFPVFFHNGDLDISSKGFLAYAQPYLLDEVARTYPDLKMIIGSMGIPFVEQTIALLTRHKNVFANLTIRPRNVWQTYNIVVSVHEQGIMDKLIFGSGYPAATAQACIETLLGFNTLMADTNLPTVPLGHIRNVIERNSLDMLGIKHSKINAKE
jgi:predicted TIM-barrel fold metal-dependent hydrolase